MEVGYLIESSITWAEIGVGIFSFRRDFTFNKGNVKCSQAQTRNLRYDCDGCCFNETSRTPLWFCRDVEDYRCLSSVPPVVSLPWLEDFKHRPAKVSKYEKTHTPIAFGSKDRTK